MGFVYDFTIYYHENQDPKKVISKIMIWSYIIFALFSVFIIAHCVWPSFSLLMNYM